MKTDFISSTASSFRWRRRVPGFVWNNPGGRARFEWTINSQIGIIDTAGDVRWYLLNDLINDQSDPWTSGLMMGFQQTKDGALTWGFGQRWVKYDLMGREIFNRKLPPTYAGLLACL